MGRKKDSKVMMDPLWDWSKGVTQSSLSCFMACREQFYLKYVEGWTKKGFQTPLEFGTLIHLMLERIGTDSPEAIASAVCNSYYKARKPSLDSGGVEAMEHTMAKAEVVFPAYVAYYGAEDLGLEWIEREAKFAVEHTFKTISGKSETVTLRGARDGLFRTPQKKVLGLFETKTKSTIDDLVIQDGLRADLQSMLYLYATKLEYKEAPGQILHNVIRRPGLIQKKTEDLRAYKERISNDIESRPDWYFRRFEVTVLPEDIDSFVTTTLNPILVCMHHWWEANVLVAPFGGRWANPFHYRSLPALETKYGKADLYDLMIRGKYHEYFQRSSPFPELEESLVPLEQVEIEKSPSLTLV